jgi:hypothetical protein
VGIPLHRGPVAEPGGDSLAGNFREKMIVYLGSFVVPRGHKDFSLGPFETLVKRQVSPELI